MGSRLRMFEPDVPFNITLNAVDGQFLFTPNHRCDNPLLHRSCPPNALDPSNDIIPIPSVINIIGSSIGRALARNPVRIHAFESNSNHIHALISADESNLENIAKFQCHVNSLIARGMEKLLRRKGHFFAGRYRMEACVDDESAEQKLFYALTNVVKDNLVEKVNETPFFSTFRYQSEGKIMKFWYIDWESYWDAGGKRSKKVKPKDFMRWVTVKTTPLPSWMKYTEKQRQTRIRKEVQRTEEACRCKREASGIRRYGVMGVKALFARDPRGRAEERTDSGLRPVAVIVQSEVNEVRGAEQLQSSRRASRSERSQPLCHSSTREGYLSYRRKWNDFREEYRKASINYRLCFQTHNQSSRTRVSSSTMLIVDKVTIEYFGGAFPPGSFRPPIVRLCNGNGL